jgi:hypothetical protein
MGLAGTPLTIDATIMPCHLNDGVLTLHWQTQNMMMKCTEEAVLDTSLTQLIVVKHPHIQHLMIDYSYHFPDKIIEYQAQVENAKLTIKGGKFDVLQHRLIGYDSGFLDLDYDGRPDIYYSGVRHVELAVDSVKEILLDTPPLCPDGIDIEHDADQCDSVSFQFGVKKRKLSSTLKQWASTTIMRYKILTINSDT